MDRIGLAILRLVKYPATMTMKETKTTKIREKLTTVLRLFRTVASVVTAIYFQFVRSESLMVTKQVSSPICIFLKSAPVVRA